MLLPDLSSPAGARVRQGRDVRIESFVSAADRPIGDSVVWNVASRTIVGGHGLLDARVETVSLNRHTGVTTSCCGDRLRPPSRTRTANRCPTTGTSPSRWTCRSAATRSGTSSSGARTARFAAEESRHGIRTYVFRLTTPLTAIGSMELPRLAVPPGHPFGDRRLRVRRHPHVLGRAQHQPGPRPARRDHPAVPLRRPRRPRDEGRPRRAAPSEQTLSEARQGAMLLPWLRGRASVVLAAVGIALLVAAARRRREVTA